MAATHLGSNFLAQHAPLVTAMPNFDEIGQRNVIVISPLGSYHFESFPMPLAVKALTRGKAWFRSGEKGQDWSKGQAILFVHGREYEMRPVEDKESAESICVFFTEAFLRSVIDFPAQDASPFDAPRDLEKALNDLPSFAPRVDEQLQHIYELVSETPAGGGFELETAFVELAATLFSELERLEVTLERVGSVKRETQVDTLKRLEDARLYIQAHLDRPVTLTGLADSACMAPYHFHRKFTATYGATPHDYLTNLRLTQAADLLSHSRDSVGDICLSCGFQDSSSFSRLFRSRYKTSPSRYRTNPR